MSWVQYGLQVTEHGRAVEYVTDLYLYTQCFMSMEKIDGAFGPLVLRPACQHRQPGQPSESLLLHALRQHGNSFSVLLADSPSTQIVTACLHYTHSPYERDRTHSPCERDKEQADGRVRECIQSSSFVLHVGCCCTVTQEHGCQVCMLSVCTRMSECMPHT